MNCLYHSMKTKWCNEVIYGLWFLLWILVSLLFIPNSLETSGSYSTFPYRMKRSRNQGEKWSNGFQRQFPHNSSNFATFPSHFLPSSFLFPHFLAFSFLLLSTKGAVERSRYDVRKNVVHSKHNARYRTTMILYVNRRSSFPFSKLITKKRNVENIDFPCRKIVKRWNICNKSVETFGIIYGNHTNESYVWRWK